MRVSDLAKELGKTNREVLDILKRNDQDVQTYSASITDGQARMVKKAFGLAADPPKKKLAAVYRPQNSQQRPPKPAAPRTGAPTGRNAGGENASAAPVPRRSASGVQTRPDATAAPTRQTTRPAAASAGTDAGAGSVVPQPTQKAPVKNQAESARDGQGARESRDGGRRDGNQGSHDGGRGTQREGYQGSRDGSRRETTAGGRDGNRRRDGQGGGYQGSRDGSRRDGQGGCEEGRGDG
ncbi:MAG: translation initiation factor IF-2 N-terminal domain-containing protein, partial [Clostridiales bacterium]|nr:translation initiation factor IF-2 N-terminal domain-containing protein [Clostridiales bacterium]